MPDSTFDPEVPSYGPAWGGAALAGLVLGRTGTVGVAAGVAAASGMKLISDARTDEAPAEDEFLISLRDTTPETEVLGDDARDWVDKDAVVFDHVVPDTTAVSEIFQEKSLPLLDDEGLPVDHVAVHPAYPEEHAYDFPFGPIIWEPGRHVQSSSDGSGETVWFGLQNVSCEGGAQPLPAPRVTDDDAAECSAPAADATNSGALATSQGSAPVVAGSTAKEDPMQELLCASVSSFMLRPDDPHGDVATETSAEETTMAELTPAHTTFLLQPLPAPSGQAFPTSITPKRAGKNMLLSRLLSSQGEVRTGIHAQAQQHLEPIAQVTRRRRPERWPLVMTLFLLLVIGMFLAAGWWRGGELLRKIEDTWLQSQQAVMKSAPRPARAAPIAEDAPKTAGHWMTAPEEH